MEVNTIRDLTRLFCRGKMAANFGLNQPISNGEKSSFQGALAKEKLAVFVSEVKTFLLCKNLRYENFVFRVLKSCRVVNPNANSN